MKSPQGTPAAAFPLPRLMVLLAGLVTTWAAGTTNPETDVDVLSWSLVFAVALMVAGAWGIRSARGRRVFEQTKPLYVFDALLVASLLALVPLPDSSVQLPALGTALVGVALTVLGAVLLWPVASRSTRVIAALAPALGVLLYLRLA